MQVAAFVSARTSNSRASRRWPHPIGLPIVGPRRAMAKVIRGAFTMAEGASAASSGMSGRQGRRNAAAVSRG
jgi:hypothetical protein